VPDNSVNLIDDHSVTVAMLANPLEWRTRVVEEITVDAATTCLRRRSLQVVSLRQHLGDAVAVEDTHAMLALYVAPSPRGPLLDFDVSGPEGDGWLLQRVEIAAIQATYLTQLAESCGQKVNQQVQVLLTAVCGFTGELLADFKGAPTAAYLEAGLGRPLAEETVQVWEEITDSCRALLRPRLDVFRGYSAPENPALVLPELFASGLLANDQQATAWLRDYRTLLASVAEHADQSEPNLAEEFLVALADYANYYDLIVAMRVPLDEPFLVKTVERRDVTLSPFTNTGTQELVIADAQTNHVTFKVSDPNVRIRKFRALMPDRDEYSYGAFQSRQSPQNRAFYAHDPDRDYRVRLSFQLGLLRRLQLVPYLVASLLLLMMAALLIEQPTDLRTLAVVVGPAALAASILLAREPSTLGSRLRLVSSLTVTMALLALVLVSAGLYVKGVEDTPGKTPGPLRPSVPSAQ
jgi:hypothetical protein